MRLEGQLPEGVFRKVLVDPADDLAAPVRAEEREAVAAEAVIEIDRRNVLPLGQKLRPDSAQELLDAVRVEEEALLSELKSPKNVPLPAEEPADAATGHLDRETECLRADRAVAHRRSFAKPQTALERQLARPSASRRSVDGSLWDLEADEPASVAQGGDPGGQERVLVVFGGVVECAPVEIEVGWLDGADCLGP